MIFIIIQVSNFPLLPIDLSDHHDIFLQVLFIAYVAIAVPETKNKTIDEITALFRK